MNNQDNILKPKKPSESASEMIQIVFPNDTNTLNSLFGGMLMQWIDLCGSVAAKRHCHKTVVTASMDKLDFLISAKVGDLVVMKSRVNRAFNSSMEVGVKVWAENLKTGGRKHIASSYLTMVALDPEGRPSKVPQLVPGDDEDKRRYEEADKRRQLRIQNK